MSSLITGIVGVEERHRARIGNHQTADRYTASVVCINTVKLQQLGWAAKQKIKRLNGLQPEVWEKAGSKLHIAFYHMAAVKKGSVLNFTLKLSPSLLEQAYSSPNFTTFIREKIRQQVRHEFGECGQYWFVIECYSSKWTTMGERVAPHLHGAFSIQDTPTNRRKLRRALKRAGGTDYPPQGKQLFLAQRDYISDGRYFFWGSRYAVEWLDYKPTEITGSGFAATRSLKTAAKRLYSEYRDEIVQQLSLNREVLEKRTTIHPEAACCSG